VATFVRSLGTVDNETLPGDPSRGARTCGEQGLRRMSVSVNRKQMGRQALPRIAGSSRRGASPAMVGTIKQPTKKPNRLLVTDPVSLRPPNLTLG